MARVVAAAQAAGTLPATTDGRDQPGSGGSSPQVEESQEGELTWPLLLPRSVLSKAGKLRQDGSRRPVTQDMRDRVQRFAAAILQAFLSVRGSLDSNALLLAAAPAAGQSVTSGMDCKPYRCGQADQIKPA